MKVKKINDLTKELAALVRSEMLREMGEQVAREMLGGNPGHRAAMERRISRLRNLNMIMDFAVEGARVLAQRPE